MMFRTEPGRERPGSACRNALTSLSLMRTAGCPDLSIAPVSVQPVAA